MTNPDVGPRCPECRLGLGSHNTADPYCDHYGVKKCTDVYMYALGDYILEFECVREVNKKYLHHHLWKQFDTRKRCSTKMNDFRCELWEGHGNGCHSKELMYELAGESYPVNDADFYPRPPV
jgi:hypothetical protein